MKQIVEKQEICRVLYMDGNQLATSGFYITNQSDVVRCVYFGVQVVQWELDVLKVYQCRSPSCAFANGRCFGTIPILSIDQPEKLPQQPTRIYGVCGPHCNTQFVSRTE